MDSDEAKDVSRIIDEAFPKGGWHTWPAQGGNRAQGCVCPPTSEQTCENPQCPRKGSPASEVSGVK